MQHLAIRLAPRSISTDYKVMLYTIGLSFSLEMGIKGLYEKTFGMVTSVLAGGRRTPEDEFALAVAEDYARFLRQVPWYEYPFGSTFGASGGRRHFPWQRAAQDRTSRGALLEWGTKAVYAKLIALGAAASPAPLRIRSVVVGLTEADVAADRGSRFCPATTTARDRNDRYATFTSILVGLAARGRNIAEIAGNGHIMVTVLSPQPDVACGPRSQDFCSPYRSRRRPGWHRLALDVKVPDLAKLLRTLRPARPGSRPCLRLLRLMRLCRRPAQGRGCARWPSRRVPCRRGS